MFYTMDDVRARNQERGQHWFSPGTMAFFKSVVETELLRGLWFITSEEWPADRAGNIGTRHYTIRRADDDGRIETEGEFMEYDSLGDALTALYATVIPAAITGMDRLAMLP